MFNKVDFVRFSANISNKFSIMKYDFWCFVFDFCEIDEQIIDAIFVHIDIDLNVAIEKRDDFDAMIEREIIFVQNIVFFDVANDENTFSNVDIDVTNEIIENELSKIDFKWLTNDVNNNIDSIVDENVAKNVDIVITVFDVDFEIVVILTNSIFDVENDVIIANSFNVNLMNSFDENIAISFANFVCFWWWF